MKNAMFSLMACALAATAGAASTTLYVGSGYTADATHFSTVQAALDAVPQKSQDEYIIKLAPGVYREKVECNNKYNLTMVGNPYCPENYVIQFNAAALTINPATGDGYGTDGSATFTLGRYNDNLEFVGVTFDNCATRESLAESGKQAGQALAMIVYGGRQTFRHCRFLGYQDTLEPKGGLNYFEDCYIEGDVDFIFAGAPSLFNRCELHCHTSGAKIAAGSADAWRKVAFLFYRCRVTAPEGVSAVLGRAWYAGANVWFVNCDYGTAVSASGWESWNQETGKTTYREYGCTSDGAMIRDASWLDGILVTGSTADFWAEFDSFGYSDLRDFLFTSNDEGATKAVTYKPAIHPAAILR